MESIIPITGKVNYQITLDPSVWIFDDRKVDLSTYFNKQEENIDVIEEYTKAVSKHWDREIMEGAVFPPTLKSEQKYEKQKLLEGNFGVPLKPFLLNAVIHEDATTIVIKQTKGELELPLEVAYDLILRFSVDGKPLKDDGPVYAYYGDGSNQDHPIKDIKKIIIK
ncbi:peptidyl-prolyl cis-trans isomerase [Bacillus sp. B15-48]|uniref:peptidyl-prolyl cis-trans isomerase n=1 Tax=Bacillus sp. B15-48 TaxID=1548601 RepID=UPI00193EE333|nr:peptidyl-prolyl cis-trans isomerase [Bacillus sp. B15-48]MBM4764070.1 peptidyl-prolyl cis-trans isomerase [Bacillus sp. B15-48]